MVEVKTANIIQKDLVRENSFSINGKLISAIFDILSSDYQNGNLLFKEDGLKFQMITKDRFQFFDLSISNDDLSQYNFSEEKNIPIFYRYCNVMHNLGQFESIKIISNDKITKILALDTDSISKFEYKNKILLENKEKDEVIEFFKKTKYTNKIILSLEPLLKQLKTIYSHGNLIFKIDENFLKLIFERNDGIIPSSFIPHNNSINISNEPEFKPHFHYQLDGSFLNNLEKFNGAIQGIEIHYDKGKDHTECLIKIRLLLFKNSYLDHYIAPRIDIEDED